MGARLVSDSELARQATRKLLQGWQHGAADQHGPKRTESSYSQTLLEGSTRCHCLTC